MSPNPLNLTDKQIKLAKYILYAIACGGIALSVLLGVLNPEDGMNAIRFIITAMTGFACLIIGWRL